MTDIRLGRDDRVLYVACRGLGAMNQDDVPDPVNPTFAGKVGIGGIARTAGRPGGGTSPRAHGRDQP